MSVEGAVPQELVSRPVILVRPGASSNVDLAPPRPTQLCLATDGLDLEFLHCVRRWTQVQSVEGWIRIRRAIQEKIVRIGSVPSNADGRALARAPIQGIHVPSLGSMAFVRT